MDLVAHTPPAFDGTLAPELLAEANGAIESQPGHHLRVGEVAGWSAHFPDAGVAFAPTVLEPPEHLEGQGPGVVISRSTLSACLVHSIEDLAVDVELELLVGDLADADGA